MKTLRMVSLLLVALVLLAGFAAAQTALTQTTLAAQVNGPAGAGYSGVTTGNLTGDTNVFLASVTGISAPVLPGTPVSVIYVGREAMGVLSVNTSLKLVSVLRGYLSTQAAPHPNGDMVLVSNVYSTNSLFGANPVPSGFYPVDPPLNGLCTAANTPTTPWVNVLTAAQWLCSTVTNTWVPGFNNPLALDFTGQTANVPAAAGAITPSGPYFIVSGAGAITGFNIPIGCNATASGACTITIISAAGSTWTWTAAGNIMTAGTGTAGHSFVFTWSASLQKFVPSALS